MKRVTIKDVAKDAGVSITTASFALNNVKGRVSEKLRKKVQNSAERLGYTPDSFAQGLRGKSSDIIALVYEQTHLEERNPSTLHFIAGAIQYGRKMEKDILIKLIDLDKGWEYFINEYIELWMSRRVEGVIFQCPAPHPRFISQMQDKGMNFVFVEMPGEESSYDCVYIDNYKLMRRGIEYVAKKGYQEIYYIGLEEQTPPHRYMGYCDAVKELGVKGWGLHYQTRFRGQKEIWELIEPVVSERKDKVAFVCWNDVDAMKVIDVLHAHGIKIPEEAGVMGFDDIPGSEYTHPPLTTIRQPFKEMAREAVDLVIQKNLSRQPLGFKKIEVAGGIVPRSSI